MFTWEKIDCHKHLINQTLSDNVNIPFSISEISIRLNHYNVKMLLNLSTFG